MGWATCGKNRNGVEIGYGVEAECDEPGCTERIDRGLGYLCGDMHDDERTCAKYYCSTHRVHGQRCERCKHIRPEGSDMPNDEAAIFDRVRDTLAEQFGIDRTKITRETSIINDLGADSLDTVELVMEIEDLFDVSVRDEDAEKISTVANIVSYLMENA